MERFRGDIQANLQASFHDDDYDYNYNKSGSPFWQFITNNWLWILLTIIIIVLFCLSWNTCGEKIKYQKKDMFSALTFAKPAQMSSDAVIFRIK